MNSSRAEMLPADDVLKSGALIFPGVFDQTGCHLLLFPAETQHKLISDQIKREDVAQFIYYCLRLHSKKCEESLVSVVADLSQADVTVVTFISETLLWLEFCRRIIHSVYIIQPKKKSVQKQLMKLLTPNSKQNKQILFKRVFLKDVFELSNYMDRSQLTCDLGGYLIYSHQSWTAFIKEIDAFVQEFLSVVNRLPSCISTLQSFAKLPVPSDIQSLTEFCSVNEAGFQQLRSDLGLDDLLKRCECLLEKLRYPETDPRFHDMAGTILFANTTLEMVHNYNRISAAVEKVELLWKQVFSKARLQLQLLHLQREAHQIQEEMTLFHREKLQTYKLKPAEDVHGAESLRLDFEASVYMHAMALVHRSEDVIHALSEMEFYPRESWVDDLKRIQENLLTSVQHLYRTLRNVSDFHYTFNKCKSWYEQVLSKSFLQDVMRMRSSSRDDSDRIRVRRGFESFLRKSSCPSLQEMMNLSHLSNLITDEHLQFNGKHLYHRCLTLRRLLTTSSSSSSESVDLHDLQLALQWQYERKKTSDIVTSSKKSLSQKHSLSQSESLFDLAESGGGVVSPTVKPPSLSSFDSGFDGAGSSSHLDLKSKRDFVSDSAKPKPAYARIHEENDVSASDSEELKYSQTQASIQILPKITSDSLNLEIKVKRSATLPKNPWLSLPLDDLESSYTVTITQNRSTEFNACGSKDDLKSLDDSDLNPVSNVLSSTIITDHQEKFSTTVEDEASLLWDTFDLHNLRHENSQPLDLSLCDWVQKEHEDLEEVEKTLNRAAEILQEEEKILEQEEILNDLLKTEDQHCVLLQQELSRSGVMGLDDDDDEDDDDEDSSSVFPVSSQTRPSSADSDTFKTSEIDENQSSGSLTDGLPDEKRRDVLQDFNDLDKQIIKERLETEEKLCDVTTQNTCEEPTRIQKNLERKPMKVKKRSRYKVVKCSIMERNSTLKDLDDEIKSSSVKEKSRSTSDFSGELIRQTSQNKREDLIITDDDLKSDTQSLTRDFISSESERLSDLTPNDCDDKDDYDEVHDVSSDQKTDPEPDIFDPGGGVDDVCLADVDKSLSSDDSTDKHSEEFINLLNDKHLHNKNNNNNKNVSVQSDDVESSSVSVQRETDWIVRNVPISDRNYDDDDDESMRIMCGSSLDHLQINSSVKPMDYKTPIVLDTGSGLMKAGLADQDLPTCVFPTIIGHPKYEEVMSSDLYREVYVGHDAQHMRGVLTLKHPIKNGIINNWDEMEMIWHHVFQQLAVDPQDHPVLLTEAAMNPLENRQKMIEMMFELFRVPLTFVALQAVLALYSSGRTTGVVMDSGDGVSHCVPVFDGYCLSHAVQRFNLAGSDVTAQLQKLLLDQGVRMQTSAELEIVREMKEKCCRVAPESEWDRSEVHYSLPDGRLVSLTTERFRAPEILFRPELIGREHCGMHESIFKSVLRSDIDLRQSFLGNILLSGGNTLLAGLPERLEFEMKRMVPVDLMKNVNVISPTDRDFSVWCGGSVLSSLSTFSSAWITSDEYQEFGPQIVFRKCF